MRLFANFLLALVISFTLPSLARTHNARRHHVHRPGELARRDLGEVDLHKRDGYRFTFYAVGLGACGWTNVPSDFIVAVNAPQFHKDQCGKTITIEANGKSAQATISDMCPGCSSGGLDFSEGLFKYFADLSAGVIYGTWSVNSGGSAPPPPSSSSPPPPATTSDIPSTTSVAPTTSSPPPSSTTTSASSTISSTSTSTSTTANSSNSSSIATQTTTNGVAATAGAVPQGAVNSSVIYDVNSVFVFIGELLSTCSGLQ